MGLRECVITLDNINSTYYPGQEVKGHVDYTFDSNKTIRGISIKFKGKSEVQWTSYESKKQRDGKIKHYTEYHSGDETYFNKSYWLIGGENSEIKLMAGTYSYPFTFELPTNLPSSFDGKYGSVHYTIKATLDMPLKFDQDTKITFTVVSQLDLNLMEEVHASINMHLKKYFCCCWCKSGPVLVDIDLPVTGYCSGRTIPFDINVENGSNLSVDISMTLTKVVTFYCELPRSDSKKFQEDVTKLVTEPILPHSTVIWKKLMEVPIVPPSKLNNCKIIDIDYEITVNLGSSGCHLDTDVTTPIIIGTIPLRGYRSCTPQNHTVNETTNWSNTSILLLPSNSHMAPTFAPRASGDNDPPPPYPYTTAPYPNSSSPYSPPQILYPTSNASQTKDALKSQEINPKFLQKIVLRESPFGTSNILDSGDSPYTTICGNTYFAPKYPIYNSHNPD